MISRTIGQKVFLSISVELDNTLQKLDELHPKHETKSGHTSRKSILKAHERRKKRLCKINNKRLSIRSVLTGYVKTLGSYSTLVSAANHFIIQETVNLKKVMQRFSVWMSQGVKDFSYAQHSAAKYISKLLQRLADHFTAIFEFSF